MNFTSDTEDCGEGGKIQKKQRLGSLSDLIFFLVHNESSEIDLIFVLRPKCIASKVS
jgi:hypothetical protein